MYLFNHRAWILSVLGNWMVLSTDVFFIWRVVYEINKALSVLIFAAQHKNTTQTTSSNTKRHEATGKWMHCFNYSACVCVWHFIHFLICCCFLSYSNVSLFTRRQGKIQTPGCWRHCRKVRLRDRMPIQIGMQSNQYRYISYFFQFSLFLLL